MTEIEQKFTIGHEFKNIADLNRGDSPHQTHYNIPWYIHARRDDNFLAVFLHCALESKSNLWAVDVEFKVLLKKSDREMTFMRSFNHTYRKQEGHGFSKLVRWDELFDKYVGGDSVTVECEVKINRITGVLQKKRLEFDSPIEGMTDVTFVVGNRRFHSIKALLANVSPVFKGMFFGNFKESTTSEVKLEDIEEKAFEEFLSIVYNCKPKITDENVANLLEIAHRYDVSRVTGKCEKFLIRSGKPDVEQKLKLSEMYTLMKLQDVCLASFENGKQLKQAIENFENIGEMTAKALLNKSATFL